jgi:putative ABC transport system permease protein
MFMNYLKVAWRNIVRQKSYSFISIFGLAVGMASCLLIAGYVVHELSFEQPHPKHDRIFRIWGQSQVGGESVNFAGVGGPLGPAAAAAIPEIEAVVRLSSYNNFSSLVGTTYFKEERIFFADPGLFAMFHCQLVRGDPRRALVAPNTVVLDEPTAQRYFGKQDPLGRVIQIRLNKEVELKVSGVFRRLPSNTILRSSLFASISTLERLAPEEYSKWSGFGMFYTFLLLQPQGDMRAVQAKVNALAKQHLGEGNKGTSFHLQPLARMHLDARPLQMSNDLDNSGNRQQVNIFVIIAILILFIAAINFINLSTARASGRRKEIGVRKTCGAGRTHLMKQFLVEYMLLSTLAMVLGVLFWELGKPLLDDYVGKRMDISLLGTPLLVLLAVALVFCVGLLAGAYPAFYLSRFKPVEIFQRRLSTQPKRFNLRQVLVFFQHAIAIGLIAVALLVFKQIRFIERADLGFDKSNLLLCRVSRPENMTKLRLFGAEALRLPGVTDTASITLFPANESRMLSTYRREGEAQGKERLVQVNMTDEHFLATFGVRLLSGRNFRTDAPAGNVPILINETAARQFQLANPVGQRFVNRSGSKTYEVVGVVRDFHANSLHSPIMPLFLIHKTDSNDSLTLHLSAGSRWTDILPGLKQLWGRIVPGEDFQYEWGEDLIAAAYADEEKLAMLLGIFCLLVLLVASLGIFGLASHAAEVRTKEIGIRKVMGATVFGIVRLITREFVILVVLANLIAWPLAYYFMNRWLQTFAYRTTIGFGIFFISGLAALVIALLTVSYQSIRTARRNPVDSLRYE